MRKIATLDGLKKDLDAANAECKNYLNELIGLRERNKELEKLYSDKQKALEGCDRLCGILIKALEMAMDRR